MRKFEFELHQAIQNFRPFSKQNTVFARGAFFEKEDMWILYFHGNPIAKFDRKSKDPAIPTFICLQGYNVKTTRSRLNSLDGVNVHVENGHIFLNGKEINDYDWWVPSGKEISLSVMTK